MEPEFERYQQKEKEALDMPWRSTNGDERRKRNEPNALINLQTSKISFVICIFIQLLMMRVYGRSDTKEISQQVVEFTKLLEAIQCVCSVSPNLTLKSIRRLLAAVVALTKAAKSHKQLIYE